MTKMDTQTAIKVASKHLAGLRGHVLDLLTISAPVTPAAAVNLAKVVSKLSPMLGNLIEFNTVEFLNQQKEFSSLGKWKRQDPGFPDAIFEGSINPTPGFEIKAWFPLATEITARFKDSQKHFLQDQTYVVLLAWLPEHLIYGKPAVRDLCIVSGASVAAARDEHYHNPPDYLVVEPNDTSARTSNLQQTNTNGYKFQGTKEQFAVAERLVKSWGPAGVRYSHSGQCQARVQELMSKFPYRLDTNFAKTDRIVHAEIEAFKKRVLASTVHGMTVQEWARLLASDDEAKVEKALREHVKIEWEKSLVEEPSKNGK
jgi:hypothetical protein